MTRTERLEIIALSRKMRRNDLRIPLDRFMRDPQGWVREAKRLLAEVVS